MLAVYVNDRETSYWGSSMLHWKVNMLDLSN